jgi:hypothetical protein
VVEKIPVVLETTQPVNVLVQDYGAGGLEVKLNGKGDVRLVLSNGAFPIEASQAYQCVSPATEVVESDRQGKLNVPLKLAEESLIRITSPQR